MGGTIKRLIAPAFVVALISGALLAANAQAAVFFVAAGTAGVAASGNVSPGIPAGIQSNDVLITVIHTRDNINSSMPAGWIEKIAGNGNTTNRMEIWWKRTSGSELTPTVTHSGGGAIIAKIYAFRGVIDSGDPFDAAVAIQSNSGSPITTAAVITGVNNAMIFHVFGSEDNNDWGSFTGTASTLADVVVANDQSFINDNSMALVYGLQSSAGSTGTAGASQTVNGPDAGVSVQLALEPFVAAEPTAPIIPSAPSVPSRPSGIGPTVIYFAGRSYPDSKIEVRRKILNEPYTAVNPEIYAVRNDGNFELRFSAILQGDYSFSLRAVDRDGNGSSDVYFSVLSILSDGSLGLDDILMPPTFKLVRQRVTRGSNLEIIGYGVSDRSVKFIIDDAIFYETRADARGQYRLSADTSKLSLGEHQIKLIYNPRLIAPEQYSPAKIFRVSALEFTQIDFNEDETVNIQDWSIFLFRTKSSDESLLVSVDLNLSGKVDIFDFSIFLSAFSKSR